MTKSVLDYPLGYSEAEGRRLAMQADFYAELTRDVLRRAGIGARMRVLDVGCGVGDVSQLVGQMVGAGGSVLGIDRAASSVEMARRRAAAAGMNNLRFETADLGSFETAEPFDAVVGRFVLLYVPDPVAALRRLRRWVRPGDVVAFQEMDMSQGAQTPPSALYERTIGLVRSTFAAANVELNMESKLLATFRGAGLPWPGMIAGARVEGGPQRPVFDYLTLTLANLLPAAERAGLVRAGDIDIAALTERLRADAVAACAVICSPPLIGAWARITPDELDQDRLVSRSATAPRDIRPAALNFTASMRGGLA